MARAWACWPTCVSRRAPYSLSSSAARCIRSATATRRKGSRMFRMSLVKEPWAGRLLPALCALAALCLLPGLARAQTALPPIDDTKARVEQLEKEVRELKALLKQQIAAPAPPA